MPAPNRRSRLFLKLAIPVVVAAVAAVAVFRSFRAVALVEPVISSEAIDARPGSVTVIPEYIMDLKSDSSGRLMNKDFNLDPGRAVKFGDVLGRMDPADLIIEKEKDQNDYNAAKARFEADHTDDLNLEGERVKLDNLRRLNGLGSVAAADLATEERNVKGLEQKLQLDKIDGQHLIDTYENQLKMDERKLEKMTITAPFDAVISVVYKHPGDLIGQGDPLAELITLNKRVEGKISEEDFAKVREGDAATVMFIPWGSKLFPARVTQILPTADPATQRHLIYLDVPVDADHALVPGTNGEVSIVVDKHSAKAIVPRRALFNDGGDAVWVVRAGVVRERKVKRGFMWETGVEVTDGLVPGEQVIVDELENFHEGEPVDVKVMPSDALNAAK
jgi:RND family efflux transporter MFP subunit